ncbi:MAG TPA: PAS domain-containing protein [Alphaproteobacteria bacterium]|nr:PAS domain-containing protein [Alphaproteobacteria bacterium]
MPISTDLAQIRSPKIRALNDYWTRIRGDRLAPPRAAFDPVDVPLLLPYLKIVEFEPAPFRVRYRLVGTKVADLAGIDFTGRYLDEMSFGQDGDFTACYHLAFSRKVPVFHRPVWRKDEWADLVYELGIFPFSEDGVSVDRAVSIDCYDYLERHPAGLARLRRPVA